MEVDLNVTELKPISDFYLNRKSQIQTYKQDNSFNEELNHQIKKQESFEKKADQETNPNQDSQTNQNHLREKKEPSVDKKPLVNKNNEANKSKPLETKETLDNSDDHAYYFSLENIETLNGLIKKLEQFILKNSNSSLNFDLKNKLKNILYQLKEQISFALDESKYRETGELKLDKKTIQLLENLQTNNHLLPKELKNQIKHLLNSKKKNIEITDREIKINHPSANHHPSTLINKVKIVNFSQINEELGKPQQQRSFKLENPKTETGLADKNFLHNDLNKLYTSPSVREIEPQKILSRLVHQIKSAVINHNNQITLKLHPEHLGKITVHLSKEDGVMAARLLVDSQAVKELLESKMQDLKDHLNNTGLLFTRVSIDLSDQKKEKK